MWRYVFSSAMQMTAPHCVFMGNSQCCKLQKISRGECVHGIFLISTLFPICQSLAFSICPPILFFFLKHSLRKAKCASNPVIVSSCHFPWLWYSSMAIEKLWSLTSIKNGECPILHVFRCLQNVIHCRQQSRWHLIMDRSQGILPSLKLEWIILDCIYSFVYSSSSPAEATVWWTVGQISSIFRRVEVLIQSTIRHSLVYKTKVSVSWYHLIQQWGHL